MHEVDTQKKTSFHAGARSRDPLSYRADVARLDADGLKISEALPSWTGFASGTQALIRQHHILRLFPSPDISLFAVSVTSNFHHGNHGTPDALL